jgi:hypothetical protein
MHCGESKGCTAMCDACADREPGGRRSRQRRRRRGAVTTMLFRVEPCRTLAAAMDQGSKPLS